MNKATELLKESKTFFIATVDDAGQPHVRPFGAVAEIGGKTYICTNNTKPCFKQMVANPKIEISAMLPDGKWFRLRAKAVPVETLEARTEFLNIYPLPMYKPDDGIFEVLALEEVEGSVDSFTAPPVPFAE